MEPSRRPIIDYEPEEPPEPPDYSPLWRMPLKLAGAMAAMIVVLVAFGYGIKWLVGWLYLWKYGQWPYD